SVALALGLSLVGHIGFVLTFYFCACTLPGREAVPSVMAHFLVVPIGMVIEAVPLFPGGAGIGELGYGGLYAFIGADPAYGVLGSLVQRVIKWLLGLVGLGVYLWMKPSLPATNNESPTAAGVAAAHANGVAANGVIASDSLSLPRKDTHGPHQ